MKKCSCVAETDAASFWYEIKRSLMTRSTNDALLGNPVQIHSFININDCKAYSEYDCQTEPTSELKPYLYDFCDMAASPLTMPRSMRSIIMDRVD